MAMATATTRTRTFLIGKEMVSNCKYYCNYYVFPFDPAEGHVDGEKVKPLVRIEGLNEDAEIAILGSTLYAFDSCPSGTRSYMGKSVYYAYLSPSENENENVYENEIRVISDIHVAKDMTDFKHDARCEVTPNGEIIVFSDIWNLTPGPGRRIVDFELFDPKTDKCHPLPTLPIDEENICIRDHRFLSKNKLFMKTTHGNYIFSFDEKVWAECRDNPLPRFSNFADYVLSSMPPLDVPLRDSPFENRWGIKSGETRHWNVFAGKGTDEYILCCARVLFPTWFKPVLVDTYDVIVDPDATPPSPDAPSISIKTTKKKKKKKSKKRIVDLPSLKTKKRASFWFEATTPTIPGGGSFLYGLGIYSIPI